MTSPAAERVQTYRSQPSSPRLQLPAHACDSHVHVLGPTDRFPFASAPRVAPADAPKEKLFALHQHLGLSRCVIVQSSIHGLDNRVVEDAIAAGGGRYLGIALVQPDVASTELQRLAAAGFRGVRFNFMKHLPTVDIEPVLALTPRLAEVGMHLQVHFEGELIHALGPALARSAVPVVIDHMGRVDATQGPDHPDFQALLALMELPLFHVKVSGIDRIDAHSDPAAGYAHGVALARMLVQRFPQRCVWGTDWPHPNHTHVPDDGALVDAIERIAPDRDHLEQLLVHNPERLYRFTA